MPAHAPDAELTQLLADAIRGLAVRFITIEKAAQGTGYTAAAIRTKIRDGIWAEGEVWTRAPDGRVLIDIEGYNAWATRVVVRQPKKPAGKLGSGPPPLA